MKTVDVLMYEGVDELDFCGPFETLASCRHRANGQFTDKAAFLVESVGSSRALIKCAHGLCVIPDKTFAQGRQSDIVIVPGGPGARMPHIPIALIEFIQSAWYSAEVIASVCTGAYLLSRAGLTDGYSITTHHALLDDFEKHNPATKVVRGHRVVVDGPNHNLMSSGGITAGIDLALALISRYEGRESAIHTAKRLEWPGYV